MHPILKVLCLLVILLPLQTVAADGGSMGSAERRIVSCYASDMNGKSCTPQALEKDGKVLLSSYRTGDRSVLASLMRLNALSIGFRSLDTQFFAQAMRDDLDGFLSALSSTQDAKDAWRNSDVVGSSCDLPGIARRPFNEIRRMLRNVRKESPLFGLAQRCRRDLENTNATLIVTSFPPNTFKSSGGHFTVQWYSSVLYTLGEKALWPADSKLMAYRFVWMRSFHDQVSITMYARPESGGQLRLQIYRRVPGRLESRTQALTKEQVRQVLALIKEANFWNMTTEGGPQGNDGAEWVLEGVQGGQYHIVTRWDASGTVFGKPLLELVRLSNYNPPKNEVY